VRAVSKQEVSKVEALGPDPDELQGLIEYLGRSFYRAYRATSSITWDFRLNLANDVKFSDKDKTDIAFHLGWIEGLTDALRLASEASADHGILDRPEVAKQFLWIMSDLAALYEDYINGKAQESSKIFGLIVDIQNRLANFYRDFMILLRTER
jgi:hypothetical protein